MALYIHATEAIAPLPVFEGGSFRGGDPAVDERAWRSCIHPDYKRFIAPAALRRMSPVIRMGLATALSCIRSAAIEQPGAILVGSGLGCVQDTLKFLRQVIDQDEQLLNPTSFIQSTHNTVSGQIAMALKCRAGNLTFTQKSFSFESALLEAMMQGEEDPDRMILLGGVDEVNEESFRLMQEAGCMRDLRKDKGSGAIAGEGAAFFLLSARAGSSALARIDDLELHPGKCSGDEAAAKLDAFLEKNAVDPGQVGLILNGRNGDRRYEGWFAAAEARLPGVHSVSFKEHTGEYDTASSFGLYLGTRILQGSAAGYPALPDAGDAPRRILLINQQFGRDLSLLLLSQP